MGAKPLLHPSGLGLAAVRPWCLSHPGMTQLSFFLWDSINYTFIHVESQGGSGPFLDANVLLPKEDCFSSYYS